jgi:hypothetical protein
VLNNGIPVLEEWALHSVQPFIDSYLCEGSFIAWLSVKLMFRKELETAATYGFSYERQLFWLIFHLLWNSKGYFEKHCANFLSQLFAAPRFQFASWWVSRKQQLCVHISVYILSRTRGTAVAWGTALQAGQSRFDFCRCH